MRLLKDKRCLYIGFMKSETYKVREIAKMISGEGDQEVIERLVRRIRYWTGEGILNPVGGKDTGSGNYREYDADEVRKVAIVCELARYGISITNFDPDGEYLDSFKGSSQWNDAVEGRRDVFLVHAEEFGCDAGNASQIVCEGKDVDLVGVVRTKVTKNSALKVSLPMNEDDFPSCLVINLTKLFSKLDLG